LIITIASGKGGTGKTTVATNLALSLSSGVQLLDCDVEQPNAHLFIHPVVNQTETVTVPVPEVDMSKCTLCGKCSEICQYNAIVVVGDTVLPFEELCHSCGGCMEVCPENAISEKGRKLGVIQKGHYNGMEFINGKLRVGEAMSPPLIKKVLSFANPDRIGIVDAPPGTSCPVITSMKNADFVILVTEPTPFGLHDLKLAAGAVKLLGIPCGLVINRSDLEDNRVHEYADEENLSILMEIPFDRRIAEAYSRGQMLVEVIPGWQAKFLDLYEKVNGAIRDHRKAEDLMMAPGRTGVISAGGS
jgi:MinD superfamily P-loop ATPase